MNIHSNIVRRNYTYLRVDWVWVASTAFRRVWIFPLSWICWCFFVCWRIRWKRKGWRVGRFSRLWSSGWGGWRRFWRPTSLDSGCQGGFCPHVGRFTASPRMKFHDGATTDVSTSFYIDGRVWWLGHDFKRACILWEQSFWLIHPDINMTGVFGFGVINLRD